jgi:hypothetical protein
LGHRKLIDNKFAGEAMVKCHRCDGIMILERFYGRGEVFSGWRCVLCGEILDSLILENRNHGHKKRLGDKGEPKMGGRRGGETL